MSAPQRAATPPQLQFSNLTSSTAVNTETQRENIPHTHTCTHTYREKHTTSLCSSHQLWLQTLLMMTNFHITNYSLTSLFIQLSTEFHKNGDLIPHNFCKKISCSAPNHHGWFIQRVCLTSQRSHVLLFRVRSSFLEPQANAKPPTNTESSKH